MQAYFSRLGLIFASTVGVATGCGGSSSDGPGNDAGADASGNGGGVEAGVPDAGGEPERDGAPPPFSTGLDGSTPLGELPPDDFQKVCSDLKDYFEMQVGPLKSTLCNVTGVLAVSEVLKGIDLSGGGVPSINELRNTCATARDLCLSLSADAAADSLGVDGFNVDCRQPDPSCDVTVNELETCTNDLNALKGKLQQAVPECDALSLISLLALATQFQDPMAPDSCERLNRCDAADASSTN